MQGTGGVASVNYAWLLVMTPLGLFGMAISTAVFPRMAEEAARDEGELRDTLSRSLRLILFLSIPATLGLMLLAAPLTALLLRSGAFDEVSSDMVAGALVFYALGLFALSGIEILSRGFYALSDTSTPVRFAVVAMAVNLVLSLALVYPFGINGVALAFSLATIVEFVLLSRALGFRLDGVDYRSIASSVARTCVATLLMAEVVALWLALLKLMGALDLDSKFDTAVATIGGVALGAAVYAFASRMLRSPEAALIAERLPLPERLAAGVRG
jgi:putative peptidoglycan lipid II flippase